MTAYPLFPVTALDKPIVRNSSGGNKTYRCFLQDAISLAQLLPQHQFVVNLCQSRYRFLVCFAAAMIRGQTTLFPINQTPSALDVLQKKFPDSYCLTDNCKQDGKSAHLTLNYEDFHLEKQSINDMAIPAFAIDTEVAILLTSGTTDQPKIHHYTWGRLCANAQAINMSLPLSSEDLCVISMVPSQHMYGFEHSILLVLLKGWSVFEGQPLLPADLDVVLSHLKKNVLLLSTPFHLRACVHSGLSFTLHPDSIHKIELLISSTASLDHDIANKAEKCFATSVLEIFGSTETGAIAVRRTCETDFWQCVTGVHLSLSKNKITFYQDAVDYDEMMLTQDPPRSTELKISDRVKYLNNTQFILLGRDQELVKVAGKRMSMTELNQILQAVPGVLDGIYYLDEKNPNSHLTAFVVAPQLSDQEIKHILRQRLDPVFIPRPLHFVSHLPRNSVGKLTKDSLDNLRQEKTHDCKKNSHCSISTEHPALEGHFPEHPIVPGVIILNHVFDFLEESYPERNILAFDWVKFKNPLFPNDIFHIKLSIIDEEHINFYCKSEDKDITIGKVTLAHTSENSHEH